MSGQPTAGGCCGRHTLVLVGHLTIKVKGAVREVLCVCVCVCCVSVCVVCEEWNTHAIVIYSISVEFSHVLMCSLPIDSRMAHVNGAICFR